MKAVELKAARQLLGLSIMEAAENIGGVTHRSWNYWESDGRRIPDDVIEKVDDLLKRRHDIIKSAQQKILRDGGIAVIWYSSPEYCDGILNWRFSQSLAAALCHDYGAKLVKFDPDSYFKFIEENNLPDTLENRDRWVEIEKSKEL